MGRTRSLDELGASDQGSGDDHPGRSTESLMVFWARSSLRRFFLEGQMEKTTNFLGDVFCCVIADQIRWCTNSVWLYVYHHILVPHILGCPRIVAKVASATPFDCDLLFSLLMMGTYWGETLDWSLILPGQSAATFFFGFLRLWAGWNAFSPKNTVS